MEIRNSFELAASPERAYALLLDLDEVVPCMPGASLGDEREDGARGLVVAVKLGPMRFNYDGEVRVVERDEATRTAVLEGSARETRGQGAASARVTMTVSASADGSSVESVADIDLAGRAAQMGHGMVQTVAEQLIGDMTRCLAEKLGREEGPPPEAVATRDDAAGGEAAPVREEAPAAAPSGSPAVPPSPAPAARPVSAFRLALRVLAARLRRLFKRS